MKPVTWVDVKSTYVATSSFYFARKIVCSTIELWPHPESPCHDVYPAEKTFCKNFIFILIF